MKASFYFEKQVMHLISDDQKISIARLRSENKSYDSIAAVLGLSKKQVRKFCEKNNLSGFKARSDNIPFEERFNAKYEGKFEYIAGYTDCESTVIVRCLKCGAFADKCASVARKKYSNMRCVNCAAIKKQQARLSDMESRKEKKAARATEQLEKAREKDAKLNKRCEECGIPFKASSSRQIYCTEACANRTYNRRKETMRRRRLRINGAIDHSINIAKLIKRDKGVCGICGGKVDSTVDSNDGDYPSIDHVIPVARGGTHTWDNVQLAHRRCNIIKSDSIQLAEAPR